MNDELNFSHCKVEMDSFWTISKDFPVGIDFMAHFSFSVCFFTSSSSCCCIIVEKLPSLMIICYFLSILCTASSSSRCSAKVRWAYLEIYALPSGGIEMAISAYNYWGELIRHLFGTDLLRSIFDLFLTVSFERLSSSCCNNTAMIASLLVAGG